MTSNHGWRTLLMRLKLTVDKSVIHEITSHDTMTCDSRS